MGFAPIPPLNCQSELTKKMNAPKKYLLVVEHSHHDARPNQPLLLEVIRETDALYFTKELFAVGLRDISAARWKTKLVRWTRMTGLRAGDDDDVPRFRIKKIFNHLDENEAAKAILVTA